MKSKQTKEFKDTEIGKIPADWKITKLENVCEKITDGSHFSPKEYGFGTKKIATVKNIVGNNFDLNSCKRISDDDFNKLVKSGCKPDIGDLIFSKDGTMGLTFVFENKQDIVLLSSIAIIKTSEKLNPYFLNYFLINKKIQNFLISAHSSGSALPRIVLKDLKKLPIVLPTIEEQERIVNFLIKFFKKIQILQNENTILEQIALAIFKSWLIDFYGQIEFEESELGKIPKGWKIESLYNCANYVNGDAFRMSDFSDIHSGLPIIKIVELKYGITSNTKFTTKTIDSKYQLYNGDILFAWSGSPETSIDIFIWVGGRGILNQHIFKIYTKNSQDKPFIFFLLKYLKRIFVEIARNKQTTGLGHVTIYDLKKLLVVLPNDYDKNKFCTITSPIFDQIICNMLKSENLKKNCDVLVSKIMSGEIRV